MSLVMFVVKHLATFVRKHAVFYGFYMVVSTDFMQNYG